MSIIKLFVKSLKFAVHVGVLNSTNFLWHTRLVFHKNSNSHLSSDFAKYIGFPYNYNG